MPFPSGKWFLLARVMDLKTAVAFFLSRTSFSVYLSCFLASDERFSDCLFAKLISCFRLASICSKCLQISSTVLMYESTQKWTYNYAVWLKSATVPEWICI
jgi:hypothetical protein